MKDAQHSRLWTKSSQTNSHENAVSQTVAHLNGIKHRKNPDTNFQEMLQD
ncbi:hypothetical protein KKF97_13355 [Myxococcota bacterium]|nr:hypothetical protein [Myxococcota bacterium]MBU1382521.1 hypothetical protein [Myxococcota bacterium]